MSDNNIEELLNYADNITETETTFSKLQEKTTGTTTIRKKKKVITYGRNSNNSNDDKEKQQQQPLVIVSPNDDSLFTQDIQQPKEMDINSSRDVDNEIGNDDDINITPPSQISVFDDTDTNTTTNEQNKSSSQESLIVSEEEDDNVSKNETIPESQILTNDTNTNDDDDDNTTQSQTQVEEENDIPESQMLVRDEVIEDNTNSIIENTFHPNEDDEDTNDSYPVSQMLVHDEIPKDNDDDSSDANSTSAESAQDNTNNTDEESSSEPKHSSEDDNSSSNKEHYPSDEDILDETSHIFKTTIDRNSVTVGDIIRTLEKKHNVTFETRVKVLIRDRLVQLVSRDTNQSDDDDDDESNRSLSSNDSSSDDDENEKEKISTAINSKPRLRKKRKRILKINKLIEQKEQIRKEEMEQDQPTLSKEDEKVMQAIADRFRTDTEELQRKRKEGFQSLLSKLQLKKKEAFSMDIKKTGQEESEDELEIVMDDATTNTTPAMLKPGVPTAHSTTTKKEPKCYSSRDALKHALKQKRIKAGNAWLARELGYKDEEEHINDCRRTEFQRRRMFRKLQEEEENNDHGLMGQSQVNHNDDEEEVDEEENEELLQAKQVALEKNDQDILSSDGKDHISKPDDENIHENIELDSDDTTKISQVHNMGESKLQVDNLKPSSSANLEEHDDLSIEKTLNDHNQSSRESLPTSKNINPNDMDVEESTIASQLSEVPLKTQDIDDDNESMILKKRSKKKRSTLPKKEQTNKEVTFDDDDVQDKVQKPKNSQWRALLEQESKKKRKKSSLVEDEAEESEEEEMAGLEDFGFQIQSKKKDNDEDEGNDDPNDDDFSDVVDDVSDNEGDEEMGQFLRTKEKAREEKEQHKEILRRIRDGYNGQRGNVSSSLHSRGKHRLDDLVAADNRESAKKLGLLVGEELEDSDDEEAGNKKKDDDEEEDEAALLDKMIKERYLPNKADDDILLQGLSDDDDEDENEEDGDDEKEEENDESAKVAKRFARQAVMNRLLEQYDDLEEFSQNKLMDEDETIRMELKTMKTVHCLKRHSSVSTNNTSLSFSQNSEAAKSNNSSNINSSTNSQTSSLFSLAVSKKRKGTFLNSSRVSFHKDKKRKPNHMGMATSTTSHVVFHNTNSLSVGGTASSSSHLMQEIGSSSNSKPRTLNTPKRSTSSNSSLWSRVSANRFRKR